MPRGKKIMGIDTNTLLLVGGGALAIYLLTKKPTTATPPVYVAPVNTGATTNNQWLALGTSLSSALSDIFA